MKAMPVKIDALIRCKRKSVGLIINRSAQLIVRAPFYIPMAEIDKILISKSTWIIKKQEFFRNKQETPKIAFSNEQEQAYKVSAKEIITKRVEFYAALAGLTFSKGRIGQAKTRWGSCSSRGVLCFHWKLVLMPQRVLDYLVVHELMHLKQQNHSKKYWREVETIIPDYKDDEQWLRENGHRWL